MASEQNIWYRVGYALERARPTPAPKRKKLSGLVAREPRGRSRAEAGRNGEGLTTDQLISAGVTALAGKVLDTWHPGRKAGMVRLLRAGAAGAAAAVLLDLVRSLLGGNPEEPVFGRDTADRLVLGAGQGLIYGSVVEPRVPGPPMLKGALFGSAEYLAGPAGGLAHMLGAHSLLGRIPFVGHLLEDLDPHDRAYLEHVLFGVALALLYGSSRSSNGILAEDE